MEKQVILISRDNSQIGMRIDHELRYIHNIPAVKIFTPKSSPEIFFDFKKEFKINVLPVVQIGYEDKFISIHTDKNHEEPSQGAGGRQINRFEFIKVNNIEELIEKAAEIYQR